MNRNRRSPFVPTHLGAVNPPLRGEGTVPAFSDVAFVEIVIGEIAVISLHPSLVPELLRGGHK